MLNALVSNARGQGRTVADFQLFKDDSGYTLDLPFVKLTGFTAGGTITKGQACIWDHSDAAATPLRLAASGAAAKGWTIVGIALNAASANEFVDLCISGFCWVTVGAATAAAGSYGSPDASVGGELAVTAAGALGATFEVGDFLGEYLGAKDSGNLAPFWFNHM